MVVIGGLSGVGTKKRRGSGRDAGWAREANSLEGSAEKGISESRGTRLVAYFFSPGLECPAGGTTVHRLVAQVRRKPRAPVHATPCGMEGLSSSLAAW